MSIIVESGLWKLDGLRSSVTFRHKTMWRLLTVRGRFASFAGQANGSRMEPAAAR
jgi:polyisoprenoid-binding protein YceI